MRQLATPLLSTLALLALSCAPATPPASPPPSPLPAPAPPSSPPAPPGVIACAVWDREVSFARTVEAHDAKAFAEHVQANAVFLQGDDPPLRGRDAVVTGWTGILRGAGFQLHWHPTSVLLMGDGMALSRGPYWFEVSKPNEPPKFLTGNYQSVWVKDADGVWRVAVDGGPPPPAPATEADIQKIKASLPASCTSKG